MINLDINNLIIKVPNTSSEISLEKGLNLQYIWANQEHNIDTKREVLQIIKPLQIWNKLNEFQLNKIIESLEFLDIEKNNNSDYIYYPSFRLNGVDYGLHPLDKLTVEEYSDIEFYLHYGDNAIENIDKIAAILYRPIKKKNNTLKNILLNILIMILTKNVKPILIKKYKIEDYDSNEHLKNSDSFKKRFTYSMGISALITYIDFKNKLVDEFTPIFGEKNTEEDPFEEEENRYLEEHEEEIPISFEDQWGFYHILVQMVPSLIERDIWLKRDIKEFFKYLSYINIKTRLENNRSQNGRR